MSRNTLYPGQDAVRELYYVQHLSCAKIAALVGVSPRSVVRWLRKASITPRMAWEHPITARMPRELAESLRMSHTSEEVVTCSQ